MKRLTYLVAVVAMCLVSASAQAPQAPPRDSQEPRIRVEVNLVSVLVNVLDANGRPIADLPKEAFEVYEEGVKQAIEVFEPETTLPLDLTLLVDTSLSTLRELPFQREAAAHFIRQVVRPGDRLAVYEFTDDVTQLTAFSADVAALQAAVRSIQAGTGTALYDAVYLAANALEKRPGGRRRVIVLVTDGGESTSRLTFEDARRAAINSEALLYTLLVRVVKGEGGRFTRGEHALLTITDVTGGAMYAVDTTADLEPTFDRVDRELRTQYRLGYYANPRPPAGAFRRIEVRVTPPAAANGAPPVPPGELAVRYRKGYLAAGAP